MNPATSTTKPTLRHQISNGFVLFTAIWSSAVMPVMPSYAKTLTPDDLPTLVRKKRQILLIWHKTSLAVKPQIRQQMR